MTIPLMIKEPRFDRMFFPKLYKVCPQAKKQLEAIFDSINTSYNDIGTPIYQELTKNSLDPGYFEDDKVRTQLFHLQKKKKSKKTGDQVPKWNFRNAALWYNVLQSDINWFGYPPYEISEETVENLKSVQSAYTYGVLGSDEVRLLYTTEISQEIRKQIMFHNDQAIEDRDNAKNEENGFTQQPERVPLKYLAFSVGDFTLSAFLMAFDLVDSQCNIKRLMNSETKNEPCLKSPDPAASIRIELTKKHKRGLPYPEFYIRTFYNGKRFKFCSVNEEYCPIGQFLDMFSY